MNWDTIIISAIVGIVISIITAYLTTRFKMKEEKEKWQREFTSKFAESNATDTLLSQRIAEQFAIGILIKNPKTEERERIFVPPNCRLIAGRDPMNSIFTDDPSISGVHCAFNADDKNVYVEDFGSSTGTFINGELVEGVRKLKTGDVIRMGLHTEFHYLKLMS